MPVIPELLCPDPADAHCMLVNVFGFKAADGLLHFGSQPVRLAGGIAAGHGCVDHIALAVPDVAVAAAGMVVQGARPDPNVTPDGPQDIPEFWSAGVRYLFLQGPGGARIELIANLGAPHGPGHDHIGIPCTDIAASTDFLTSQGAQPMASFALHRGEGTTPVRFLTLHGSVLELYQPPVPPRFSGPGLWQRLLTDIAAPVTGPDGLTLAPL